MHSPEIIYEDADFLVINKPAGLVVHAVKLTSQKTHTPEPTLVDWLLKRYPEIKTVGDDPDQRPGIVHRLDKDTSGVMLVARNQKTFEYLKKLFQEHKITKTYLAVVAGDLEKKSGIIDAPIGILTGTTRRSVRSTKMAKEAITEYKVLNNDAFKNPSGETLDPRPYSLLEVHPKTGRTHQIRVHLASIGHPIVGDVLYGPKKLRKSSGYTLHPTPYTRLMLHALSIEFAGPDGKQFKFEAEPPSEFIDYGLKD